MTNCTRFTVECLHCRSQMQITSKSQLNCMWMSPLQITHANHMWITFKLHVNVSVPWAQGLSCHTHRSRDPAVRHSLAQCNTMSNTMSNAWATQRAMHERYNEHYLSSSSNASGQLSPSWHTQAQRGRQSSLQLTGQSGTYITTGQPSFGLWHHTWSVLTSYPCAHIARRHQNSI